MRSQPGGPVGAQGQQPKSRAFGVGSGQTVGPPINGLSEFVHIPSSMPSSNMGGYNAIFEAANRARHQALQDAIHRQREVEDRTFAAQNPQSAFSPWQQYFDAHRYDNRDADREAQQYAAKNITRDPQQQAQWNADMQQRARQDLYGQGWNQTRPVDPAAIDSRDFSERQRQFNVTQGNQQAALRARLDALRGMFGQGGGMGGTPQGAPQQENPFLAQALAQRGPDRGELQNFLARLMQRGG